MSATKKVCFLNGSAGIRLGKHTWSVLIPPGQTLPLRNESTFSGTIPGQSEFLFNISFLGPGNKQAQKQIAEYLISSPSCSSHQYREFTVSTEISLTGVLSVQIYERISGKTSICEIAGTLPVVSTGMIALRNLIRMRIQYLTAVRADHELLQFGKSVLEDGTDDDYYHFLLVTEGYLFPQNQRVYNGKGMKYAS